MEFSGYLIDFRLYLIEFHRWGMLSNFIDGLVDFFIEVYGYGIEFRRNSYRITWVKYRILWIFISNYMGIIVLRVELYG